MKQKKGGGKTPRFLIIGIGNEFRSDDGVGLAVARSLVGLLPKNAKIIEESGEGASLMNAWSDVDGVIIIDAVKSGALPGRIHQLDATKETVPTGYFNYSSHAFGVAEAIEISRTLGNLPATLHIYGIEGKSFSSGTELSPEVRRSAEEVKDRILQDVNSFMRIFDKNI